MGKIGAFRHIDQDVGIQCTTLSEETIKLDREEFTYELPKLFGAQAHMLNLAKQQIQASGATIHMSNYVRHGINWQIKSISRLREIIDQLPGEYPIASQLGSIADSLEASTTLQSQCNVDITQQSARNLACGANQIRKFGLDQTEWRTATHKPLMDIPIPSIGKSEGSPVALLFGTPLMERLSELGATRVRQTVVNQVLGKKSAPRQPSNTSVKPAKKPKTQNTNQGKGKKEDLKTRLNAQTKADRRKKAQVNFKETKGKGRSQVSTKTGSNSDH
jgi:hypothetical protein